MENKQLTREFLVSIGFTIVTQEDIEKHSHWFVAVDPVAELRIAVNLSPMVQRTPFTYITLESHKTGWCERIYRGLVSPEFLIAMLALRKIKK